MKEKINHSKYILILKYGYMLFFAAAFTRNCRTISTLDVVLLLMFIINNQLRYFLFPNKNIYTIPSLALEAVICYIFCLLAGNYGSLIFIPSLIDIIFMFNRAYSIIYIISAAILLFAKGNTDLLIIWIIVAFPIFLLLSGTKEIEIRKYTAQNLYDKLREKDEELKIANKELESYANTIEEITLLRERNRISREIHDNVGHALSTIIIQLGAIKRISEVNGQKASEMAENLEDFARESMERVRDAVHAMKPREFEEYEGIVAISEMIKNFRKLTGIEVSLCVSDKVWKLNSDQTMVIYRIIQEFLSNSIRHGKATEVKVFLNFLDTHLRMQLKDNGVGCNIPVPGAGLSGIKERVSVWGGTIEYYSKEGYGFELIVTMDKVKLSMDGV